jgi:gliding motility-associated-like protein
LNAIPSVGTGTWTKTAGTGTATFSPGAGSPNAAVTVSAYGIYKFTWTEVNGSCSGNASINVSFIQSPPANAGSGGNVCGSSFHLNAVPGLGTGTWTKVSGPGNAVFSPDANQSDATVTADQFGVYVFAWTEVNSTCLSTAQITVTFNEPPQISAGRDTVICKGKSVSLNGTGTGTYHWTPETDVSNPTIANPVVTPVSLTTFRLTVTDLNGCVSTDSTTVDVLEKPIADAGSDLVLDYVFGTPISAVDLNPGEYGVWSIIFGSGTVADTASATTTISGLSLGKNVLLWTVSNNVCQPVRAKLTITVNDILIPTLITPNMDGRNDYFLLKGIESLGKTELIIFDRWGVMVYTNSNYNNEWNGVSKDGNPLPDDTYFYVLKTQNGISKSGYIVIRR